MEILPESQQPPPLDLMNALWTEGSYLMALGEVDGRLIRVTPSWTEVLGWSSDELTSRNWGDLIHPDDLETARGIARQLRDGHDPEDGFELRFRTKDGGWRWLRGGTPTLVAPGLALTIAVDATREREASDRLAAANERLARLSRELLRSNEELTRFAFVASHDLHEPLRKVKSFCDLLQARYAEVLDERGRQFIEGAVSGATRMQALLDALLDYSRAGGQREPQPVGLEDAVATATDHLALAIRESGAVVQVGPLPRVAGDPDRLVRLFQNLIGNAIKYVPEGRSPHVDVSASTESGRAHVRVRDNGVGIPADRLEDIFELLTRLHARNEYAGTGIGLATCRRIVEGLDGRLWAESEVGEGSTFHVVLPLADPAANGSEEGA